MSDEGKLNFVARIDDTKLAADAERVKSQIGKIGNSVEAEGKKIDAVFSSMAKKIAGLGVAFSVQQLATKVAQVRGEFQKLEVAFTTMLGDANKANALMLQLTKTAATTPFGLQDVAGGAKQLLAYGMEAEKVNETLIRLGDIAAGLGIPLQDLTYLFGTTMVQGRLYTADFNQFIGRGIPLVKALADQFGIAEKEVKSYVEAGRVGFPEIEKAIIRMTSEGGQFGGLMEAQSKTIAGQIANLEDAIDMMFNSIGKESEGIISGVLSAATSMVENFERVGKTVLELVAIFGAYRTAVMFAAAAAKGWTAIEIVHYHWLLLVEKAQKALNMTMLKNPYVAIAALVATLAVAMYELHTRTTKVDEINQQLAETTKETNGEYNKEIITLNKLKDKLEASKKGSDDWLAAKNAIVKQYGQYRSTLAEEIEQTGTLASSYDALVKAIQRSVAARGLKNFYDKNSDVQQDAMESMGQMREFLSEKYGEKYTTQIWSAIQNYLTDEGAIKDIRTHFETYFKDMPAGYGEAVLDSIYDLDLGDAEDSDTDHFGSRLVELRNNMDAFRNNLNQFAKSQGLTEDDVNSILYGIEPVKGVEESAKNKKYWEDQKKELQGQLDALTAEEAAGATGTELRNKINEVEKKLNAYNVTSASKAARQAATEENKRLTAQRSLAEELLRLQQDTQNRELEIMEDGTEKRIAQVDNDYNRRIAEINKLEAEWKKENVKAGVAVGANGLTDAQTTALEEARFVAEQQYDDERGNIEREELDAEYKALNDFLKQYGTYQEKKLAIARDYADRIANATTEGERQSLHASRDKELQNLELEQLKHSPDWSRVFVDMAGLSTDALKKLQTQILQLIATQKSLTSAEIAQLYDQYNRIGETIKQNEFNLKGWLGLSNENAEAAEKLRREYEAAKSVYEELLNLQKKMKQEADEANKSLVDFFKRQGIEIQGNETEGDLTKKLNEKGVGQDVMSEFSRLFSANETASSQLANVTQNVSDASGAMEGAGEAAAGAGGSFAQTIKMIDTIVHGVNDNVQSAAGLFKELGLEETRAGKFMTSFAESSEYATQAWESFKSGNVFGVAEGVVGSLRTLGDALGALGIPLMGSSDYSLHDDIERLTYSNQALIGALDMLSEEISAVTTSPTDAIKLYETQGKYLSDSIRNTQEMMSRSAKAYSNGFLGLFGEHSSGHEINKAMNMNEWRRISEIVGKDIYSASDFFKLSAEEMLEVYKYAPDLYAKIKQYASEGYEDAGQFMDEYIEYAEKRVEIEEAYKEALTSVSFDDMYSNFIDTLMDMEATAEDFAEDIAAYFMRAMLNERIGEKYKDDLQKWYDDYVAAMESDGLDANEIAQLSKDYNAIVDGAIAERDALAAATGYDKATTQEGSSKGFTAMSQDTADELNGRFTTMVELQSKLVDAVGGISPNVSLIAQSTAETAANIKEVRDLSLLSIGHLETIAKNTNELYTVNKRLAKIEEYTSRL